MADSTEPLESLPVAKTADKSGEIATDANSSSKDPLSEVVSETKKSPLPEEPIQALEETVLDTDSVAPTHGATTELIPEAVIAGTIKPLEADIFDDADSAIGSYSASDTQSITSSILKNRQENGRTYHSFKDGAYLVPNDESEKDRMDLQHHLNLLTYEGKLNLCPFDKEKPIHRVLDVGTGTGIWAIEYADEHPEAEVLGIDLSRIQPDFVPPNVQFLIDDVEADWIYSTKFDFINCRMMTGSIKDWPKFFKQAFDNTTPGGYIELYDPCYPIACGDGTMSEDSALNKWSLEISGIMRSIGLPLDSAKNYQKWLYEAGWTDVTVIPSIWPMNHWPADKKYKELGYWMYENFSSGLSGFSMALMTRILGWTATEVEIYLIDVRKELKDTSIHAYMPLYTFYARKPL